MNLSQAYGPFEQIGCRARPHTESMWVGYGEDSYKEEWVPLGTCPDCVEAAMHDATHIVWEPRYRRPFGALQRGILQGLMEESYQMKKIPWSTVPLGWTKAQYLRAEDNWDDE